MVLGLGDGVGDGEEGGVRGGGEHNLGRFCLKSSSQTVCDTPIARITGCVF